MDYKVIIANDDVQEEVILNVFEKLQNLVLEQKNIDMKNFAPFMVEGQEAVMVGTTWGVSRPDMEDVEELSALYPDLTFHVIKVSTVLNSKHFETLNHYSLSVYENGNLMEVMKPEPITWKSVHQVEYLPSPWS